MLIFAFWESWKNCCSWEQKGRAAPATLEPMLAEKQAFSAQPEVSFHLSHQAAVVPVCGKEEDLALGG